MYNSKKYHKHFILDKNFLIYLINASVGID